MESHELFNALQYTAAAEENAKRGPDLPDESSATKPVVMRRANKIWCSECGDPTEAKYELRNGGEVESLCELCFKDTLLDLVTSNWQIHIREIKDATMPITVYELL